MAAVYAWGAGTAGQLGDGSAALEDSLLPVRVSLPAGTEQRLHSVACGGSHCVILLDDGSILAWGAPVAGHRGAARGQSDGPALAYSPEMPTSLSSTRITKVAAGWAHTLYLTEGGRLLSAGEGSFGQLGTGVKEVGVAHGVEVVRGVLDGLVVSDVAAGLRHSLAVARNPEGAASSSSVLAFGSNSRGQLGIPTASRRARSLRSGDGDGIRQAPQPMTAENLPDLAPPLQVIGGGEASGVIDGLGQLYLWGRGSSQGRDSSSASMIPHPSTSGLYEQPDNVCLSRELSWDHIAMGWRHFVALDTAGAVFAWGSNQHGQCGESSDTPARTATDWVASSSPILTPKRVAGLVGIECSRVSAGSEHSAAVSRSGKLFTWGWGEHGQLGAGDCSNRASCHELSLPSPFQWNDVCCGGGFSLAVGHHSS